MKAEGIKDKIFIAEDYVERIEPYLRDLINDHKIKESGEWKVHLNMHVAFISSNDTGEIGNINILSGNEKIMWGYNTDDNINNLFISFKNNYQSEEQIMREGNDFILERVERLDYKLHKIKIK